MSRWQGSAIVNKARCCVDKYKVNEMFCRRYAQALRDNDMKCVDGLSEKI